MDEGKVGLKDRLWNIKPDQDWKMIADIDSDKKPRSSHSNIALKQHFRLILSEIKKEDPLIETAYLSITGITPGQYVAVESIGRDLSEITDCPQDRSSTQISSFLNSGDKAKVKHFENPFSYSLRGGESAPMSKIIIKLVASDELFGFISVDTTSRNIFSSKLLKELQEIQPFLSRIIAESVFSMRLWELAKPLYSTEKVSFEDLCQDVVERALLSFGGSGSILRLCDDNQDIINESVFAFVDEDSQKVVHDLLEKHSVGEKICKKVLNSKGSDWTIGQLHSKSDSTIHGMSIDDELENSIREKGIKGYSVFRIETSGTELEKSTIIGTLSIFHLHHTGYSWRDVALAKQLVKRAADVIAMHKQTLELRNTKEDLEIAVELLKIEEEMATRAEIVTLLSHDLGHKAIAVQGWLEDYISSVKKTIRENRSFTSLETITTEGEAAISGLLTGMNTVNKLFNPARDNNVSKERFNLIEAIEDVERTLSPALQRNNCSLIKDGVSKNVILAGNRNIFLLVIFNLIINSIDAQKTRRSQRPMSLKVFSSQDTSDKLMVSFNDTGPGINRQIFPLADEIFKLGKSSKEKGTGRGLTISRNLLGQFYGADLILVDPKNAHFKIIFPKNVTDPIRI